MTRLELVEAFATHIGEMTTEEWIAFEMVARQHPDGARGVARSLFDVALAAFRTAVPA